MVLLTVFPSGDTRRAFINPDDLSLVDLPGASVQTLVKDGEGEWFNRGNNIIPLFIRYTGNPHSGLKGLLYHVTGDRFTIHEQIHDALVCFEVSGIAPDLSSGLHLIVRSGTSQAALELTDDGSRVLRSEHILPTGAPTNLELSYVTELVCPEEDISFLLARLRNTGDHAGKYAEPNR